jgi:transposase
MYAQRTRRVKTDRRDARALAHACKLGAYRPAHRISDSRHQLRAFLGVRETMVRTCARWITHMQALLRREGVRVRTGAAETFKARLDELRLPTALKTMMHPLVDLLEPLNQQIEALDNELGQLVTHDDVTKRLVTVPGVGPVTAVAFVATLDEVTRFRGAHQVESYLGLVPQEWSSSETQRRGHITKTGSGRVRWLLVQAAWCILQRRRAKSDATALRLWADRIAGRRGRLVAVVALARRLAGILYAIWRDGTEYNPSKLRSAVLARPA